MADRDERPAGHLVSWSLVALALSLVGIGLLPVPYVKLSPGPLYNVLGQEDGRQVIGISDATTYPVSGELDLLTVTERGGPAGPLTLPEAYMTWFDRDQKLVPRDLLYPPDQSSEEAERISSAQFSQAESNAIAAALSIVGVPVSSEAVVVGVAEGGPSMGLLNPDDVIERVGDVAVKSPEDVTSQVRAYPPGADVDFSVRRDGAGRGVVVRLGDDPQRPGQGRAGIVVGTRYQSPFPIEFGLEGIGGPSAGLVFSLGLVDRLTPDSLTGGRKIAATGTIDADGRVGPIGGVQEKAAAARNHGAELLLIPKQNCSAVSGSDAWGIRAVPVSTLAEAVSVMKRWVTGAGDLPVCP